MAKSPQTLLSHYHQREIFLGTIQLFNFGDVRQEFKKYEKVRGKRRDNVGETSKKNVGGKCQKVRFFIKKMSTVRKTNSRRKVGENVRKTSGNVTL